MIGQLVRLARWQKREIERIYDNPAGTRLAILSFGRCKNGKNRARRFFAAGQSMRPDRLSPAEFAVNGQGHPFVPRGSAVIHRQGNTP